MNGTLSLKNHRDCPLRKAVRMNLGQDVQYVCSGGLNFYLLNPDDPPCNYCPVPIAGLEALLQCPQSDIYVSLQSGRSDQPPAIKYEVQCFARQADVHCSQCPHMTPNPLTTDSTQQAANR